MTIDLRVSGWINKAAQFSGRDVVQILTCLDEIIVLTKAIIIVTDWIAMLRKASEARVDRRLRRHYLIILLLPNIFTLACLPLSVGYGTPHDGKVPSSAAPEFDSRIGHHVKKGKRGACRQKAAMVLPDRTAAT